MEELITQLRFLGHGSPELDRLLADKKRTSLDEREAVEALQTACMKAAEDLTAAQTALAAELVRAEERSKRLWLWKNFVDGKPEYWAFDNPYPCYDNGDPMTLGEPCGYAIFKPSRAGRTDVSDEQVIAAAIRAQEGK